MPDLLPDGESFDHVHASYDYDDLRRRVMDVSPARVDAALAANGRGDFEDFLALLSPAASGRLEEMAELSRSLTQKRFGRTMRMYIPIYLSNLCHNVCTYCGFSMNNQVPRIVLTERQVIAEVEAVRSLGYDNILLLTGEAKTEAGFPFLQKMLRVVRPLANHVAMEVQPLSEEEYRRLADDGLDAVYLYQETYHRETYRIHHPKGMKSHFRWRLEGPDRLGRAGVRKIGLGALLGLEDWRVDSLFTALHLRWLQKKYWKSSFSVSFPRLRPAEGVRPKSVMSEADLVQLMTAWRIFDGEVEIALSTRENARFRDNAFSLGPTAMSAGSRTNPGGYAEHAESLEQFRIDDERSAAEVAEVLLAGGYQPVWKDWDRAFA